MKTGFLVVTVALVAFAIGYSLNNIAISDSGEQYKVAVVDLGQIALDSSDVKALRKDQDAKLKQMQATINKARLEISKETDKAKAEALQEKYRTEINSQKLAMDEEYNTRLTQINNEIKTAVVDKARQMNYQVVFPKNVILFGGDDITSEIEKEIQ